MFVKKIALAAAVVATLFSGSAFADAYVFGNSNFNSANGLSITTTAGTFFAANTDSGWYDSNFSHNAGNKNYIVGTCCGKENFNNYFTFDLSSVTGTVLSASLKLQSYSVNSNLTYQLFDVLSPLSTVKSSGTNSSVYYDLMSGANFGSYAFNTGMNNTFQNIQLNATGISALNNAVGGDFAIGGTVAAVPEAETYAMLLVGLGLVGTVARRRKQQA